MSSSSSDLDLDLDLDLGLGLDSTTDHLWPEFFLDASDLPVIVTM